MNILYISDVFPKFHAPGGAPTKFFCQLREVAKKHKVTLLTTRWKGVEIDLEELKGICERVVFYDFVEEKKKYNRFLGAQNTARLRELRHFFFEHPLMVEAHLRQLNSFKKSLEKIDLKSFDLIQFESLYIADRAKGIRKLYPNTPLILELFDVNSLIEYRAFKNAKTFRWKIFCYSEWKKMVSYERKMFPLFDKIFVVSEEDRKLVLSSSPNLDTEVIPNGVDVDFFNTNGTYNSSYALSFVGSNWPPNVDAIIYFFNEIWKKIKIKIPELRIYIIGSVGENKVVKKFHNASDIVITGKVKDVRKWVEKSEISIVPLRLGGGTKLKILEAMSMKRPIISTSVGCEGLKLRNNEHIIIADSPEYFASQVDGLLKDKKLQQKISHNARKFVEENYNWNVIGSKICEVYDVLNSLFLER